MNAQPEQLAGDRISNLPDELLVQILSNLPTKEAIRTEILSTRWISVWTCLETLHLDYDDYYEVDDYDGPDYEYNEDRKELFRKFVDRALLDHKMPCLRNVFIDYPEFNLRVVKLWLSAAMERNINILSLGVSSSEPILVLPQSFFFGSSLVQLQLYFRAVINFPVASPACFPKLKVLQLSLLRFEDNDSGTNLISSCPILEDLDITTDDKYSFRTLCVSAPCLKTFSLHYTLSHIDIVEFNYVPIIHINTPALEHIKIFDYAPNVYEVKDFSSLLKAEIHLSDLMSPFSKVYFTLRMFELLNNISNVESLMLVAWPTTNFSGADAPSLPTFRNLTTLGLQKCYSRKWKWNLVIAFLKRCPMLEVLIIEDFAFLHSGTHRNCYNVVPSCLKSHLKTIEVGTSSGGYEVIDDMRYFLKNANVLEKLILKGSIKESREILTLPRASPTCRIEFE